MAKAKTFTRRQSLALLGALAAPAVLTRGGFAQSSFPTREIKVICAFPAGSGADVLCRFYAEGMKPSFNQPIIVENRVGAAGLLAQNHVARARPDGYTVMIHGGSSVAANMSLFKNPGADVAKTLECLGTVSKLPFAVSVRANAPWKTFEELVSHLRAKGDKGSYAVTAPTGQVTGALMRENLKLQTLEVAYRTAADSLNDLASGQIDFGMYDTTFAVAQVRGGRIRMLAHGAGERLQSVPGVPTLKELGVGNINVLGWWTLIVPTGVAAPIKAQLAAAFEKMARSDATREFLAKNGTDPFILSAAESQKFFLQEIDNWREYVRIAKIPVKG